MALGNSIVNKIVNIKDMHIERYDLSERVTHHNNEEFKYVELVLHARPYKRKQCLCPECMKKCPVYDHQAKKEVSWIIALWNGVPVKVLYQPVRIECPEHGVLTEYIPWADGNTRFSPMINDEVAFMALTCPRTVVAQYFGINWRTVGNCIKAAHDRIESDVTQRLHGLRRICVDETSYRKGHKYITVVYDLDRNRVAWVHEGHGFKIFELFCKTLNDEEQKAIEVLAGDGAKWIDQCQKLYLTNARRCVDFFHVVGWANEALDKAKSSISHQAADELKRMKKEFAEAEAEEKQEIAKTEKALEEALKRLKSMPRRGRPSKEKKELQQYAEGLKKQLNSYQAQSRIEVTEDEYRSAKEELSGMPKRGRRSNRKQELMNIVAIYEGRTVDNATALSSAHKKILDDLKKKSKDLKGTKYALGMNPENLSQSLKDKLKLVSETQPVLFKAYQLKEKLRIILHMKDVRTAEMELDKWIEESSECEID